MPKSRKEKIVTSRRKRYGLILEVKGKRALVGWYWMPPETRRRKIAIDCEQWVPIDQLRLVGLNRQYAENAIVRLHVNHKN